MGDTIATTDADVVDVRHANFVSDREPIIAGLTVDGTLQKLRNGLYYFPRKFEFGEAPADERELVRAFLKTDNFVLGLRHQTHADELVRFRQLFEAADFWIFNGELDAYDFGVPQVRHRLFIVGFNKQEYPRIEFELPSGIRGGIHTVRQAIGHLPKPFSATVDSWRKCRFTRTIGV